MKSTIRTAMLSLAASLLLVSMTADAHHSFPAQYDVNKQIMLEGKVTRVEWTNPHIFIYLDVQDPTSGEVLNWALELGGPNALLRLGWKRNSLKIDDAITVEGSLARNGSPLVNATTIILNETGQRMLAGSSRESRTAK